MTVSPMTQPTHNGQTKEHFLELASDGKLSTSQE